MTVGGTIVPTIFIRMHFEWFWNHFWKWVL